MNKRDPSQYAIVTDVPRPSVGREALDREALAAFQAGEYPSKLQTGYAFLSRYFGKGALRLSADQQESKARYIRRRMSAIERRSRVK